MTQRVSRVSPSEQSLVDQLHALYGEREAVGERALGETERAACAEAEPISRESFVSTGFLESLDHLTQEQADRVPFGVVRLDDNGVVQLYNAWESEMAGVSIDRSVGRNFFTEVAPCTNNRLFFGRFADGVVRRTLDVEFNYTFTYRMRPTNVTIRLYRAGAASSNWVFVAKTMA
jgi:photoactive yellow protein